MRSTNMNRNKYDNIQILSSDYNQDSDGESPIRNYNDYSKRSHEYSTKYSQRREVIMAPAHDDYYSDHYEGFGDVEDMGVITTDPDQRGDDFPICSSSIDQQNGKQFLI